MFPELKAYSGFEPAVTSAAKRAMRFGLEAVRKRSTRINFFQKYGPDEVGPTDAHLIFAHIVDVVDKQGGSWEASVDDMAIGTVTQAMDKKGPGVGFQAFVEGELLGEYSSLKKALTALFLKEYPDDNRYFIINLMDPEEVPVPVSQAGPAPDRVAPPVKTRKIARPPTASSGSFGVPSGYQPPWSPANFQNAGAPPSYPGKAATAVAGDEDGE